MSFYTAENFHDTSSVGFLLNKARSRVAADMDGALSALNVKAQYIGILTLLMREMGTTPAGLSRQLGVDSGLMTRMLDRLNALALLDRSRDTVDRRVVNLQLTAAGRATAQRVAEIASDVLNGRLRNFSSTEHDELRRLLCKLLHD